MLFPPYKAFSESETFGNLCYQSSDQGNNQKPILKTTDVNEKINKPTAE